MKKQEKQPNQNPKLYDLIKKEEKIKGKLYKDWTSLDKLNFVLNNRITKLNEIIKSVILELDQEVSNNLKASDENNNVDESLMSKDIKKLQELGLILIKEEEKHTMYNKFSDPVGCPYISINDKIARSKTGIYYKNLYFIHPEKAIYIAIQYIYYRDNYNVRTDVRGYMEVPEKYCFEDINKHIFWDWSIDILEDGNMGLPIYKDNFSKVLEYLTELKILPFTHPLPAKYLLLEVESYYKSTQSKQQQYCDELISSMEVPVQKYFDNSEESYQKKKRKNR